ANAHAAMLADAVRRVVGTRVDGDLVTTIDETRPDLLHVVLDTANGGWNPSLADEGDAGGLHAARCRIVRAARAEVALMRWRCRSGGDFDTMVARARSRIEKACPGSRRYGLSAAASACGSFAATSSPVAPGSISSG